MSDDKYNSRRKFILNMIFNKIYPQMQVIKASEINDAWDKVVNREARYRFVIDASTF